MEWHHLVEQCQSRKARSKFSVFDINATSNIRATPHVVHVAISAYYSGKDVMTNNKTVRDWLNGQSFEFQFDFGMQQWEKFMTMYGYSVD